MLKKFDEMRKVDVLPFCEKRDGMLYLNWAKCIDILHEHGAEKVYFVPIPNERTGGSLYYSDVIFTDKNGVTNRAYETRIKVVIDDAEYIMQSPVMNGSNPVKDNSMSQQRVWNSMCRSFVKCVAIHTGLGFNLWLKEEHRPFSNEIPGEDPLATPAQLKTIKSLGQKHKDFNKSQLQEMLYLTDDQIEEAEPEMSAKEIRAIRKPPEVEVIALAQQIDDQIPGQDSIDRHPEYMPGKMTIETATGQNRPPENEIPITPELQIERFFEALNRGDKERVLTCEINAITYLLEARYQDVRIRNGNFNYQANSTGIMFNPGSYMECAFTWNELAHELIKRFGKKRKPVKMTSVDTPEKKKDNEVSGPAKCITGKSKSGICGAAAYCNTEYKCCVQCTDDCNGRCGWLEERCQSAAETPDEKQQDSDDYKTSIEMLPENRTEHLREQPPLPDMRNNDQRKQWLREYKSWGLWYTDPHIGVRYYKYDFNNGARLIAEEYDPEPRKESWWVPTEPYFLHLVGGPEPERSGGVQKWTYHSKYHKFPNSETELVEFLKEVQKNG